MSRRVLIVIVLAMFLHVTAIGQQQFDVPTTAYPTIGDAIDAASNGDVIVVADHPESPGFWDLDGFYDLDFSGQSTAPKRIIIRSANGPGRCIINLGSAHYGFNFDSHEDQQSVLQGFTFLSDSTQNATTPVILCTSSSPRIVNCRFVNRKVLAHGPMGAAIRCDQHGNPVITHCEFIGNSNVIVNQNQQTGEGGAISIENGSSPVIQNCIFRNNKADRRGGAIYAIDTGGCRPVIANCIFDNNRTERANVADFGGAMYFENVNPSISNCLIFGSESSTETQADNGSAIALAGVRRPQRIA